MTEHEPTTTAIRRLRACLSEQEWQKRTLKADERYLVIEKLQEAASGDKLRVGAIQQLAGNLPRTTVRRLWGRYNTRDGEPWERLMDRRLPPEAKKTPDNWEAAVRALGRQEPQPDLCRIREILVAEYGPTAAVCDNTLKRILRDADLWRPKPRGWEHVVEMNGGGVLVPVLAACIESGALKKMAEKISTLAKAQESPADSPPAEPSRRNEHGQITKDYNQNRLDLLEQLGCTFYRSVEEKRKGRDLSQLRLATLSPETLEQHLRCAMVLPLLTERRGSVGLDGPAGAWLEIVSPVAYKAATIDKTLGELTLLGANDTMWESHAESWLSWSNKWAGAGWRQLVDYVDATYDPWWTRRYATSGKVSRTGRVQPCLSRIALTSGPGVPIIVHVESGTTKLTENLLSMLEDADRLRGEDTQGRITVVDAECCTVDILQHFKDDPKRDIITVVKGGLAQGKSLVQVGEWVQFRQRDRLREGKLELEMKGSPSLSIRVVEMEREGSRNPKPTWYATTADVDKLSTVDVAEAYLSRWPHQEDLFKRSRNGAGLERSRGYGVTKVTNVAIVGKREKAGRSLANATVAAEAANDAETRAERQLEETRQRLADRKREAENLDGRHKLGVRLARKRLDERRKAATKTEKEKKIATEEYEKQQSMPDEIYVRDTAADSIATCLKMVLLAILEFFCQENLAHLGLTPRTIIEEWLMLPVTIHSSRQRVVYEVAANPRNPGKTELLGRALARITERKLKVDGRLLIARIRDRP